MIYFIADTHFGHNNIIRFCTRPFSCASEMDEAMAENWNARVGKGDEVYILGDLIFKHPEPELVLKRLKGRKHLIIGNHDHSWMKDVDSGKYFESVDNYAEIAVGNHWAVLSHYPMLSYLHNDKYFMIHGHIHNNTHEDFWPLLARRPLILNAGVEINNYIPVTLPELIANNEAFKSVHGADGEQSTRTDE